MEQRVLTVSKRFNQMDNYAFNIDSLTSNLNLKGWVVKQVVSTSFVHKAFNSDKSYPVLAITLLVEKG